MWSIQFTSWHSFFFVFHHESESSWILNMLILRSAWQWNIRFSTPRLNKNVANEWRGRRCQHPKYPANYQWWISVPSSRTPIRHSHGVFLSISNISLYIFLLQTPSFFKVQLSQLLVTERMVANVTNKWKFNNSSMVTSDALLVSG